MARRTKSKINKSSVIRELKAANPDMGPKEIAAKIFEMHAVTVSPGTVSTVLSTDKRRNGKVGKPGRPKGSKSAGKTAGSGAGNYESVVESLMKVRQLVTEMGGISQARRALDAVESLMSAR